MKHITETAATTSQLRSSIFFKSGSFPWPVIPRLFNLFRLFRFTLFLGYEPPEEKVNVSEPGDDPDNQEEYGKNVRGGLKLAVKVGSDQEAPEYRKDHDKAETARMGHFHDRSLGVLFHQNLRSHWR